MNYPLCLRVSLTVGLLMGLPLRIVAHPAHHESIEWAIANSDRVIIGKVIKATMIDKHDVITVDVQQILRGEQHRQAEEPKPNETFVLQQYCSGYAKGWLEDGLPMMFFLVKIDGAKRRESLPAGFDWVLHENGNGNSAVLLGSTDRRWPGTMDVFTRRYDYLSRPSAIVEYVNYYANSIPTDRVVESITVDVPYRTSAYRKVFPPQYPGNAFFLRVPVVEQRFVAVDWPTRIRCLLGAAVCCVCVWCLARWIAKRRRGSPTG